MSKHSGQGHQGNMDEINKTCMDGWFPFLFYNMKGSSEEEKKS